jgi:glycosyltransferase involved in cell wall biosynthesis
MPLKRIALITDGIWPYVIGGMQKHSYYLCKYFAANGIHVDLIHFNKSDYDISKLEFFSEKERAFILPTIVEIPVSARFPGHYIYNSYRHSKLIFNILKPRLQDYDLIYTKGFTGWHLIDQKYKGKVKCCKIGVKFHGYEMFQPTAGPASWLRSLLLKGPVKKLSRRADLVFSYGGKITEIIRSFGVENSKIIESPSGIEDEFIAQKITNTGHMKRVLFLGRYERRKGIEELHSAIGLLNSKKNNSLEFHFIGNIPEDKKMRADNVTYHGEIRERQKIFEKMRNCDVLVCPSYSEGFPNVILEALSNGLAVAATPVGAVELMVSSHVGWIISAPTARSILNVFDQIIDENKFDIDQKKQNAIQLIKERFTWNIIFKKLIRDIENHF